MSDNVIRKYTYLQGPRIPSGLRPHGIRDLQVGIFPYYVIRHGITNSIADGLPPDALARRQVMRHINNLARTKGLNSRMKGEVLLIDGKRYTDVASLPHGLNLADAKTLSINNGIAFEGPESYMSNLYPCKLIFYGVEYNSAEQAFCHLKATVNKQPAAAEKILATTDPLTAKLIVKGVKVS